jgi:hypothetical protein
MYNYNAEKGSYRVLTLNVYWHLSGLLIKRNYVRDEFVYFYNLLILKQPLIAYETTEFICYFLVEMLSILIYLYSIMV